MAQELDPTDALNCFASMSASYEYRIGHACRAVARHIPALLSTLPPRPIVLDNACGTGAVTEEIRSAIPSAQIYAVDVLPSMVQSMKSIVASKPELQEGTVNIQIMDSQKLRFEDNFFDVSVMSFGIFFLEDPMLGAKEMLRTLKPGRTAVVTIWKELRFRPVLWEVQRRMNPISPLTELSLLDRWCDGTLLRETLQEAGFAAIEMRSVVTALWGTSREDLEGILIQNFEAMVSKYWTDEEKAEMPAVTAQVLDDSHGQYCIESDGKIGVPMTAWVVLCRKA